MRFPQRIRHSFLLVLILLPVNSGFAGIAKTPDENTLINCFFKNVYNFSFNSADSVLLVI